MKTDIEYAAMVMAERVIHDCNDRGARITGQEDEWNPLHDDGDSRRLEVEILNCPYSYNEDRVARAWEDYDDLRTNSKGCARISTQNFRAAVFALAVAIGKTMEGNDNAG